MLKIFKIFYSELKLLIFIALRYLRSPNYKFLPSIGIALSISAVTLSISILIIVMSVMNGFHRELLSKIININSHINIISNIELQNNTDYNNNLDKIYNIKQGINTIKNQNIIENITPITYGQGMIFYNNNSTGILIKGISQLDLSKRTELTKFIKGNLENLQENTFNIIIGADIAFKLNIHINDKINIITPISTTTIFGMIPRYKTVNVIGILKTGATQYDSFIAIMNIKDVQTIYNLENKINLIEILLNQKNNNIIKDINKIKNNVIDFINTNYQNPTSNNIFNRYKIITFEEEHGDLINAMKIEANVMSLLLSLFVIISMFTIFAIMNMMIKDKTREIAILKSMGLNNKKINIIFFIIGIIISSIGIFLGNTIGITIASNIESIKLFFEHQLGLSLFNPAVYFLSQLPSEIIIQDIININIFCFILSIIAILLPSLRAAKKDPAEILRYF